MRSSIRIALFVPIRYQTWPPQTILVSDWLISKKSFHLTAWPNDSKFGRKHPKAVSVKKILLEINQSETRIAFGDHVCQRIGTKLAIFMKHLWEVLY
jgi:hypothetical protein